MRYKRLLLILGILGFFGTLGVAGPVAEFKPIGKLSTPFASDTFDMLFEANKRATAICVGLGPPADDDVTIDKHSNLGMYILDAHGNCVGRDEIIDPSVRDVAAVEWYPLQKGRYTVEIVNFGNQLDNFELAIK